MLEFLGEFLRRHARLTQESAQSAGSKLGMKGHDATDVLIGARFIQYYVAAALTNLTKARALQYANGVPPGDAGQSNHMPPRRSSVPADRARVA